MVTMKARCPVCDWQGLVGAARISSDGEPICPVCLCCLIAVSVEVLRKKGVIKGEKEAKK